MGRSVVVNLSESIVVITRQRISIGQPVVLTRIGGAFGCNFSHRHKFGQIGTALNNEVVGVLLRRSGPGQLNAVAFGFGRE